MRCWFGNHVWGWFSLTEGQAPFNTARISQCLRCRKIKGGWVGKEYQP